MTSLRVICGLGPPQSKILATLMYVGNILVFFRITEKLDFRYPFHLLKMITASFLMSENANHHSWSRVPNVRGRGQGLKKKSKAKG